MCTCGCISMCTCATCMQEPEEGVGHSRTGVTGGWESADMEAGKQTQAFARAAGTHSCWTVSPVPQMKIGQIKRFGIRCVVEETSSDGISIKWLHQCINQSLLCSVTSAQQSRSPWAVSSICLQICVWSSVLLHGTTDGRVLFNGFLQAKGLGD